MTLGIRTDLIPIASAVATMVVLLLGVASVWWSAKRDARKGAD